MVQAHVFKAVKYLIPENRKRKRIRITSYSSGLRSLKYVERKSIIVLKSARGEYINEDTKLYYVPWESAASSVAIIDYIY